MKKETARIFLFLTQLLLLGAFGCLMGSLTSTYWFNNPIIPTQSIHFGLFAYCGRGEAEPCKTRTTVFEFKKEPWPLQPLTSYDFDLILLFLVISIVFIAIALIISLLLCCVANGRQRWRLICTCVVVMVLVAVVSCLIAIGYFEGRLAHDMLNKTYSHGWSSLVAWVGFGCLVVDAICLIPVACAKPDDHSNKAHSVPTSHASTRDTMSTAHDNGALEFTELTNVDAFYVGRGHVAAPPRKGRSPEKDIGPSNIRFNESDMPVSQMQRPQAHRSCSQAPSNVAGRRRRRSFELAHETPVSTIMANEHIEDRMRSERGMEHCVNNLAYQPGTPELAYDPRKRMNKPAPSGRRKPSFEMACVSSVSNDSGISPTSSDYYRDPYVSESSRAYETAESSPISPERRTKSQRVDRNKRRSRSRNLRESNEQLDSRENGEKERKSSSKTSSSKLKTSDSHQLFPESGGSIASTPTTRTPRPRAAKLVTVTNDGYKVR